MFGSYKLFKECALNYPFNFNDKIYDKTIRVHWIRIEENKNIVVRVDSLLGIYE